MVFKPVLLLLALVPASIGFNFNTNSAASGATGVVCALYIPGTDETQVFCIPCASADRTVCAQTLRTSLNLNSICSNNATNSTIPSGTCVTCLGASNQIASCTSMTTVTNGVLLTDAQFRCLERMCANSIEFFYDGLQVAQKNKVLNFGGSATVLGKRDVTSASKRTKNTPLHYRTYFEVEFQEDKITYVSVEED